MFTECLPSGQTSVQLGTSSSRFVECDRKREFYNIIRLAIAKKDYQSYIKAYQLKLEGKDNGRFKQNIIFYVTLEDAFKEHSQNKKQICQIVNALFPLSNVGLTKVRLEFVISLIGRALEFRNADILDCLAYYLENCKNLTSQKLEFLYKYIDADLINCSESFCASLISGGGFEGDEFPIELIRDWLPRLSSAEHGTETYKMLLLYLFQQEDFDSSLMSVILVCLDTDPGAAEQMDEEFVLNLFKSCDNSDPKIKYSQYFSLLICCNITIDFSDSFLKKYSAFKKLTDEEKGKLSDFLNKYHKDRNVDAHMYDS